jgi:hypothetical protein
MTVADVMSVHEHDVCRGVAHPVVQRPGYYLADELGVHFVLQHSQESSVLNMSRAFDDYYIEDCGIILAPEVTQRRTDNNDQFVILATVGVVSAFRDRGSLRPTSECRVPQPRWVERVGEHKGGRERGGRSPA